MRRLIIIILGLSVVFSSLAEENCDPAVDAADSMNVNQQGCDYSDEGLNGFLQKAFKKGEEGAVLEAASAGKSSAEAVESTLATAEKNGSYFFALNIEVDQWANLPVARMQLLSKALERCSNGFSVTGESYRSLKMGRIELRLKFECDN